MCDYTQVNYKCSHLRFTVRAWCTKYQETHRRCPANVVAVEYRLNELCGDCRSKSHPNGAVGRPASATATAAATSA
ncbi:hypothetical protein HDK77DRAFT_480081 [Phyllosticta capitalensis]|uniref:Uncharacterized protein n=1 Tax=Phyllosticta capitalensis TaxID=121624 RepID=A0ABR1YRU8_9PEZI